MRPRKRLAVAIAVAVVWCVAAPAAGAVSTELGAELRGLVRMPGGPPGAIAIVQRGRQVAVYRAGVRDVTSGSSIQPTDRMRLASVSKTFSGAVALALVQRHVLSLRDRISGRLSYLPADWGRVTLGEALHHTSGLPSYTASPAFVKYLVMHPHAEPSPRFVLGLIAGEKLLFRPGTRFAYSNTDNSVVALMAEAATHRSYDQLLSRYIYTPLGLRHTSLPNGATIPAPFMRGYAVIEGQPPEDLTTVFSNATAWAAGGIVSTPQELNRFARAYVGGRLFGSRARTAQFRFVAGHSEPTGPGVNAAGLAIFRYRTRCGAVYGHTGNTFGYTQFMAATRDGSRSVTMSITEQLNENATGAQLAVFTRLRAIEEDAVCAALR